MTLSALHSDANDAIVAQSSDASIFESVTRGAAGLAIWRRVLPHEIASAAALARRSQLNETVTFACSNGSLPANDTFLDSLPAVLRHDMLTLLLAFRDMSRAQNIRLRLETVADDGCRRFHVDNVRLRLVTTYAGAGTQWAPPELTEPALAAQEAYRGPLGQLQTGDVALFRGRKCQNGAHVNHRSPPIGEGPRRLVCVIDEAFEP